jgi:hypothetical protein
MSDFACVRKNIDDKASPILTHEIIKAVLRITSNDLINEANFRSRLRQYLEEGALGVLNQYRIEEEIRKNHKSHGIRWIPDIIVHKPARLYDISVTEGNLVAIELKISSSKRAAKHVFKKLKDYREKLNYEAGFFIDTCKREHAPYVNILSDDLIGNWKDGYLHEIGYNVDKKWLIHVWYDKNGKLKTETYESREKMTLKE